MINFPSNLDSTVTIYKILQALADAGRVPLDENTPRRFLPRHYTFGFEKLMTAVPEPLTRPAAPFGQVGYRRSLVTPDLMFIVRPNNDTIYGAGYVDPSAEPILIRAREVGKRFWSIQFADAWTNIAPGIGSRSGSKPGLYAFVGPKWKGKLPDGATEVRLGDSNQ